MQNQALTLLSLVGLASQFAASVLLATLYGLLAREARRRGYFLQWGRAWMVLAVTLGFLVFCFQLLPLLRTAPNGPLVTHTVFGIYQLGKLLWCALLLAGTAQYVHRVRQPRRLAWGVGIAVGYSLFTAVAARNMTHVFVLQSPVASAALVYCAVLLLRLPASRRTLGSRFTGVAFAANAALWAMYGPAFFHIATRPGPHGLFLNLLASGSSSLLDEIVAMALGYGMVVMMLEDAKREVDAANAELAVAHHQLRRAALLDPLTGSLNRRAFEEGVGLEQARGTFGAVGMIDVDNLKAVNDAHGHAAGDALLRRLADTVRSGLRPSDKLYRWGGDEFLLVMPGASGDDLLRRTESVVADAGTPPLLISIGAAEYEGAEGLALAIPAADVAMYEEKKRRKLPGVLPGPRIASG